MGTTGLAGPAPSRLTQRTGTDRTELPDRLGKPALRALAQAGISDLDAVAGHSRTELSALHGVGPRAIGILAELLAADGRDFRS
ncbi:hypothetical protein ACF3NT_07255 [Naumannella halotolerans]|uniref:Helix-hairpin-helix protein n=1 Tax=Naumannella halotolerans TaxID=993414 RepID=A0A4R7J928_9ACTN|nr:hypothetical protein [Naumannella halotolerans]TDT33825.1 hypothetical protein CLV29_1460 [Naumannella halotolerans]